MRHQAFLYTERDGILHPFHTIRVTRGKDKVREWIEKNHHNESIVYVKYETYIEDIQLFRKFEMHPDKSTCLSMCIVNWEFIAS